MAGYYGFTLDNHVSIRPSVVRPSIHFSFPDDNLSKHQWIFTKLGICALILSRSGLGLLIGKFRQFFTELTARDRIMWGGGGGGGGGGGVCIIVFILLHISWIVANSLTLIRRCRMQRLIWDNTVCSGLSVRILRVNIV